LVGGEAEAGEAEAAAEATAGSFSFPPSTSMGSRSAEAEGGKAGGEEEASDRVGCCYSPSSLCRSACTSAFTTAASAADQRAPAYCTRNCFCSLVLRVRRRGEEGASHSCWLNGSGQRVRGGGRAAAEAAAAEEEEEEEAEEGADCMAWLLACRK
jgi:hypothetical protein